jgi:hypothetical protein
MKRNEEVKEYLQSLKKVAECEKNQQHGFRLHPTCVNATTIASMLNEYHFNVEYQHVPAELRNMTYHIEDLITAVWYPYMSTNHGDNAQHQNGKIQVAIKVHPIQKNFDLKIKKPTATIVFNKVPLDTQKQTLFPINAKKSIVARTFNKILGGYYNTKCLMGKNKVATFDKVVYEAKLKNQAFHLLTKDCSGLYKFAVLVKQQESKKIVRVIVKNTIVQTMPASSRMFSSNGLRVLVNGQEQVLPVDKIVEITEQGKTVIRLIAKQNGVVEIRAPKHGFVVLTNGEQVIVKASNTLRSKLCGLCGDFNGEKTADLKTPEKCIESPREPRDFVRSYAIDAQTQQRLNSEVESTSRHGRQQQSSFYSKYFGTPVSYLTGMISGRRQQHEQQYNIDSEEQQQQQQDFDDEITFGQRSQYTRSQCVRELDDSSRQGKQWRQENSLLGSGDHDMKRSWESNQYNKYNQYDSEYDSEYDNSDSEDLIEKIFQNREDLLDQVFQNREQRRRFQDQDDFESEDNFYNTLDSSVYNQESLFSNDFDRRQFGKWDREDKYDQENQYELEGRRRFNSEQDSEEFDSEDKTDFYGQQYNKYNNKYNKHNTKYNNKYDNKYDTEYDQELNSEIDSEEMIQKRREQQLRSEDSDEEDVDEIISKKNFYNNQEEEDYENTDDSEEYQQDKYERSQFGQRFGGKSQKRCTVLKHKIVERNGKMCFSIRPRVACNKHASEECKPVQHQTKTVKFYCAQTPLEARYLETKVQQQQAVRQLLQKPVHFTEQLELPTQCTATGRGF